MKRDIIASVIALIVISGIAFTYQKNRTLKIPQTFEELIQLSDEEIENFDIGRMNLLCAKGLPGSEDLDIEHCLQKLDQWAKYVRQKEAQDYPGIFLRNRAYYKNSLAFSKGIYLALIIKQDLGCDYNQQLVDSGALADMNSTRFFHDSSDIFINGLLQEGKGTCSSLPVLMAALGRKCNYPLYLVDCRAHAFVRWDDGAEKHNFEITSVGGVNSHSDEYYKKWPYPMTEDYIREESKLKNLTNKEILGTFAKQRTICLYEHKRYEEAVISCAYASKVFPLSKTLSEDIKRLEKRTKPKGAES